LFMLCVFCMFFVWDKFYTNQKSLSTLLKYNI
jgi:hypothetical protein